MIESDRKKVLIIDDDSRNIFALKAVLRSRGYECETASTALTGFEKVQGDASIGIILLDIMMPEMDGYEALKYLKSGELNKIPVIAVTAQAMKGDREKCIELGADEYLSKPVDVDLLLYLLNKFLNNN